jgi:hypothetical protein
MTAFLIEHSTTCWLVGRSPRGAVVSGAVDQSSAVAGQSFHSMFSAVWKFFFFFIIFLCNGWLHNLIIWKLFEFFAQLMLGIPPFIVYIRWTCKMCKKQIDNRSLIEWFVFVLSCADRYLNPFVLLVKTNTYSYKLNCKFGRIFLAFEVFRRRIKTHRYISRKLLFRSCCCW